MGSFISSYIFPHPPIIIPEIGRGEENNASSTVNATKRAAQEIKKEKPTTIIITTPHGPAFSDYIYIPLQSRLKGDLGKFGAGNVKMEVETNISLAEDIVTRARQEGITAGDIEESILKKYGHSSSMDHGVTVPLYYVNKEYADYKLVYISVALMPFEELYRFGMCIKRAVEESNERVVLIASGDLSHRLTHDAPYGFNKHGREFDDLLIKSVEELDVETLMGMDEDFCRDAGECGLRSFLMMFGALDGYSLKPDIYSYEGPFGVGYSIARIGVGEKAGTTNILSKVREAKMKKLEGVRKNEDPYVRLARKSLETYIREQRVLKVPDDLPEEMLINEAGTFVSIKKDGQLRGCIGTTEATRNNVAEEIIYNAISSGTRDPRFDPVEEEELDELVYSVDVLGKTEPIASMEELDVIRYGVIVKTGRRSGLLLPNLDGVDTPEQQVSIALQKAGIKQGEKYEMERFEVIRHKA